MAEAGALRALRESEERFRLTMEHAPIGVAMVGTDGSWIAVNPALCRMLGYSTAELLSLTFQDITHPADLDADLAQAVRLMAGEIPSYRMEKRYLRKDGGTVWALLTGSVVRDEEGKPLYCIAHVLDVTEQKEREAALRESERRLRALIENASDLITILDADGIILYESPAASRVLGYAADHLVGGRAFDRVHPDDLAEVTAAFERVVREPGLIARLTFRFRHRDGTWRHLEGSGTNLLHDPAVGGIVVNSRDVSDRVEAEEAHRKLALIVESSGDAIYSKSLDGVVLSWNEAAERMYGYTAEEMVGEPITTLIPAELESDEATIVFRLMRGERIDNLETVRLRKDGRRIHVSLTISPIRSESGEVVSASVIARDVTRSKQVEAELRASNERYYLAGRAAKDIIWEWDLRSNKIEWGEAIYATFGLRREEVHNDLVWWAERVHPADMDGVSSSLSEFLASGAEAWSCEYRFQRGDGSYARVLDRGFVVRSAAGIALRMIGSMADVTVQRENEAALRRAKEVAEAASRSKSEFLSGMSHELRTPLNSVIGFTNVMRKNKAGNLREQDLTYLERIQANGMHLLGLINDILDISKIEAGKMEVDLAPVALDALVEETLAELQGNVRTGVEVRTRIPAPLAPMETDERKLKQILINLVGNALKFTEAGSVTVSVSADPVTRLPLRIDITDTGVGIQPDHLCTIFEAFRQGEGGTARRFGGTGLGLAISSSLSGLLGYEIEVESELGMGSTFSILLGAARRRGAPPRTRRAPAGVAG